MFRHLSYGLILVVLLAPSLAGASGVHALFDLSTVSGGPFPADRFTVPDASHNTGLRVGLPKPADCDAQPTLSVCGDVETLNTLDGFNLQPRLSIPFSGPIDVNTVSSETVFLVSPGGRRIGINQVVWDVESNTLHVESDELLDQHTRYVLIVTRGVRDLVNEPLEASGAFQAFRHGKKTGHVKDDPAVTAYRPVLIAALERAGAAGVDLNHVAVASVFTTQSITAILEKIRDQIQAATPEPADFLTGPGATRTVFPVSSITNIFFARHLRGNVANLPASILPQLNYLKTTFPGAVGQIAFGKYLSPDYLTPCTSPIPTAPCDRSIPPVGTRTGTPQPQVIMEDIFFTLFLPSGTPPPGGWPVVIFGIGSDDSKNIGPFRIASTMAAHGLALIAINGVGQGLGPLSALTVNLAGGGAVSFSAGGRSFDQNGDGVIGTGLPITAEGVETFPQGASISRRDSRRQTVVDHMQLVRVLEAGMDVDGDGAADLDASRIYYFGFSHGADHGTLFAATEPRVRAVVLSAVGGNVESFRISSVNRSGVGMHLGRRVPPLLNPPGILSLGGVPVGAPYFDENLPPRDQPPVINPESGAIAMGIQRVIDNTQWALQSNDAVVYAPYLRQPVIVQFARGDQTIPNPATSAVLRAGGLAGRATFFRNDLAYPANQTLTKNPHPFATRVAGSTIPAQDAIALQAQRQAAVFFASDGAQTIDPDGPCDPDPDAPLVAGISGCFFETPILGPLPEDLGFIP